MRVPVLTGSLSSIVFLADRETSVEEINEALQDAARDGRWSGVLATTSDPLVSSDIVGDPHGAVVDLSPDEGDRRGSLRSLQLVRQ